MSAKSWWAAVRKSEGISLFWVLLGASIVSVSFHELMYRRFSDEGDYEFNGLITHAGVDLVLQAILFVFAGFIWAGSTRRNRQ